MSLLLYSFGFILSVTAVYVVLNSSLPPQVWLSQREAQPLLRARQCIGDILDFPKLQFSFGCSVIG
jgi:hypothetical protein